MPIWKYLPSYTIPLVERLAGVDPSNHATASRKYQVLRSFEKSPQLPTGYPGMILLALVPPVWFRVMDALVDRFQNR